MRNGQPYQQAQVISVLIRRHKWHSKRKGANEEQAEGANISKILSQRTPLTTDLLVGDL